MVATSKLPAPEAMSNVTFWRNSFSGSTTHLTVISGYFLLNSGVSFCIVTMSGLLTVAMVMVLAAWAIPRASAVVSSEAVTFINPPETEGKTTEGVGLFQAGYEPVRRVRRPPLVGQAT